MDTSETYINMCRKATMLQDNHTWEDGDYFAYGYENKDIVDVIGNSMVESTKSVGFGWFEDSKTVEYIIWLPRLDQLIELTMVNSHLRDKTASGVTKVQSVFCGDGRHRIIEDTDTIEIAWLKLYMRSNNKYMSWNGEDWT